MYIILKGLKQKICIFIGMKYVIGIFIWTKKTYLIYIYDFFFKIKN